MPTLAADVLRPRNAKYPIGTRFTLPTDEVDCDGFDAERTTPARAVWAITGANTGANCHSYACECAATNGFIFSRQLAAEFVANELQGCGDVAVLMDRRAAWPTTVGEVQ